MKSLLIFLLTLSLCHILPAQDYATKLTDALTQHFEASNLPGFAVAIVNEKGILYQNGFGYANKQTKKPFESTTMEKLGSTSKTVVGLALVKAIQDGKLTMDTKINDILPFQIHHPRFKDTPILVRHLATHTSGILDTKHYGKTYIRDNKGEKEAAIHQDFLGFISSHENISLKDFLFRILSTKGIWYKKKNFLKAKPGVQKEYANLNAALAAYVIEIATGIPFDTYTQTSIFLPLGMKNTTWYIDNQHQDLLATAYFPMGKVVPRYHLITYPDGGLHANAIDLSLLLREMIKAYNGNSEYLPAKYAQLLLPGDADENRAFWGMNQKSRNIGHSGADPGAQTDMHFNADNKIGRIILTNVNAEDNDELQAQYRTIHQILAKFENKLNLREQEKYNLPTLPRKNGQSY